MITYMVSNKAPKVYTDEIAIRPKAHTNRKCINGYSLRGFRKLNSMIT